MSGKIIAVCGANGAGKSTVCANLAVALGGNNIVVVFGARTDYPSIQSFFNISVPEEKGLTKLYENISLDMPIEIKDYLVQYGNSNVFIFSASDNMNVLSLADGRLSPSQQQCSNILFMLQDICDYLIIDCDTNISNEMSAWGMNKADKVINVIKPTQQSIRVYEAYRSYFNDIWRGEVIHVANADRNYIGISQFEKILNIKFAAELPYDEQVELAENTGVPAIETYHKTRLFGGNYRDALLELVSMIKTEAV